MADHSHRGRGSEGSRSPPPTHMQASASSSRPFLNLLNPMGRHYHGYAPPGSLAEEDESADEQHELEEGRRSATPYGRAPGRNAGTGASGSLHPNVHEDDQKRDESSSDDGEVPQSFMVEAAPSNRQFKGKQRAAPEPRKSSSSPVLPSNADKDNKRVSMPPRPAEIDPEPPSTLSGEGASARKPMRGLDAYERALWNWVNVYNLDAFLQEVYQYYQGKGIYCIAISRGLNLLTVGFVIVFSTFLLQCIDYARIKPESLTRLSDVLVPRCIARFSGFTFMLFVCFTAFYIWQIVTFIMGITRLIDMYNFYTHLLNIPDADIQTISWPEIVRRIEGIREENPVTALSSASAHDPDGSPTAKLDAHDIANRIMRQENYLIALVNKELLDLRVPLPPTVTRYLSSPSDEGKGRVLTRTLEWNLRFCLMEYLFDRTGRVRKVFLKERNRKALIEGLKRRFIFMGILNAIFVPFIVIYLVMYFFFRYFEEYHKNPSSIGGRSYTPYAQWKFREFNELPHHFSRRLNESYQLASLYINQFPNERLIIVMRFVAFVSGSFVAVLFLASVVDPDLIVHFEITSHKTVIFYLTVFGSILAVARGMVPEDNSVFDPEKLMTDLVQYTHYMPAEWKNRLHSQKVHGEFGQLFAFKVITFARELVSVIVTPFILWFSLPDCAPSIIDFFREFSIHVDGLGYVCSFAVFDFQRHGNVKFGAPTEAQEERFMSREGKMEKSFLNFKVAHPDWVPTDPTGSMYLNKLAELSTAPRRVDRRPRIVNGSDRTQEYDRALRHSQQIAASRRQRSRSNAPAAATSIVRPEDQAPDGGVGSELGESYVDGRRRPVRMSDLEEEDGPEDGGMLKLLGEIYGTRGGNGARILH